MIKRNLKLVMCAAIVCSMMALAACGGKDSAVELTVAAETKAAETEVPETKAVETTGAETEASGAGAALPSGKFATVAEFADSDVMQSQLEMQKKSFDGMGMDIAITGEDNKLIYTFTYLEIENADGMAEALQQGLDAQASTFSGVAKSIKLAVDVENPVVVVRYLDANGEEIYSAEFTAD